MASRCPSSEDKEDWQTVSISQDGNLMALILANPVMI
jgi:hypothetical protein